MFRKILSGLQAITLSTVLCSGLILANPALAYDDVEVYSDGETAVITDGDTAIISDGDTHVITDGDTTVIMDNEGNALVVE